MKSLVNIKVSLEIAEKHLGRGVGAGHVEGAEAHGQVVEPVDGGVHRQRHRRVGAQRVVLRRNVQRCPCQVSTPADRNACLSVNLGQPPHLLAEPLSRCSGELGVDAGGVQSVVKNELWEVLGLCFLVVAADEGRRRRGIGTFLCEGGFGFERRRWGQPQAAAHGVEF